MGLGTDGLGAALLLPPLLACCLFLGPLVTMAWMSHKVARNEVRQHKERAHGGVRPEEARKNLGLFSVDDASWFGYAVMTDIEPGACVGETRARYTRAICEGKRALSAWLPSLAAYPCARVNVCMILAQNWTRKNRGVTTGKACASLCRKMSLGSLLAVDPK